MTALRGVGPRNACDAGIELAVVRLDLGEPDGDRPRSRVVLDHAAEQLRRDDDSRPGEERPAEDAWPAAAAPDHRLDVPARRPGHLVRDLRP